MWRRRRSPPALPRSRTPRRSIAPAPTMCAGGRGCPSGWRRWDCRSRRACATSCCRASRTIPGAVPRRRSSSCARAASRRARWRPTACRNICGSRSGPARRWRGWRGARRVHEGAMSAKLFDRAALIGIGLIGSSLARALRRDSPGTRIVACARRSETLATARRLGLADETTRDPAEAVRGADLVVIATPISAYAAIGRRIGPALEQGAILTDVGSVKEAVIRDLRPRIPPGVAFVPGHPVAGTEHSGPEAGFADLFRDRWCILIPLPETPPAALARIAGMWEQFGMRIAT